MFARNVDSEMSLICHRNISASWLPPNMPRQVFSQLPLTSFLDTLLPAAFLLLQPLGVAVAPPLTTVIVSTFVGSGFSHRSPDLIRWLAFCSDQFSPFRSSAPDADVRLPCGSERVQ